MVDRNTSTETSRLTLTALAAVFVVLKLAGIISWSWWWVLSPLWLPLVLLVAVLVIYLAAIVVIAAVGGRT